jgi:transposase
MDGILPIVVESIPVFDAEGVVMKKKYLVRLTDVEHETLREVIKKLKGPAGKVRRAQILLKADASGPNWTDQRIAEAFSCRTRTVENVRQRLVTEGFEIALCGKKRSAHTYERRLDDRRLQELARQSPRSFGKKRSTWTLQLLADTCSEIGIADGNVSHETVRRTLKRMGLRWRRAELWMTSPDPHYAEKKARRDRFVRLAGKHPEWVVGFLDEVWWSRLARPPLRAWSAGDPLKIHVLSRPKDDTEPVAISCYGLLRQDTNRVMLRFVEGRPVGDVTAQFLSWLCEQIRAEGKSRLIVIWDVPSWHSGRPVSDWLAEHNRGAKRDGGVQVVLCPLPVKSPWLNNIETRWGPAKCAILELDRILTAQEVVSRVCDHFGSNPLPYLKSRAAAEVEVKSES